MPSPPNVLARGSNGAGPRTEGRSEARGSVEGARCGAMLWACPFHRCLTQPPPASLRAAGYTAVSHRRSSLSVDPKQLTVTVPDDQLSLAIGKNSENERLAAKLVGWRIDIRVDESVVRAADDSF